MDCKSGAIPPRTRLLRVLSELAIGRHGKNTAGITSSPDTTGNLVDQLAVIPTSEA